MMPGGSKEGYDAIKHIVEKVAAQVDDGPCVTYIGPGGAGVHIGFIRLYLSTLSPLPRCDTESSSFAGNFVKQVHNGIEYGDMQLISEVKSLTRL